MPRVTLFLPGDYRPTPNRLAEPNVRAFVAALAQAVKHLGHEVRTLDRFLATPADAIDALLPQTQCTRCGYPDCRGYADAVAAGEAEINQCPPGGAEGVARLSALTGRPVLPLNPVNGIEATRGVAVIDEAWCIGCTLCIKACPADCIVGAPKAMHVVGFVSWFAGLFYIVRLFIYHVEAQARPEPARALVSEQLALMEKRLWLAITVPAMFLTLGFGGYIAWWHASAAGGLREVPWLHVKLTGKGRNSNAIGALITVRAGGVAQLRLVQSGTSYLSQDDMRQHFGLGPATQADSLEVRWPDGTTTRLDNVKADQIVAIKQP